MSDPLFAEAFWRFVDETARATARWPEGKRVAVDAYLFPRGTLPPVVVDRAVLPGDLIER